MIATLCENLDSLDEPEARAAMIWIVGEYAERIDNADELLESFLEGFHDESTQVLGLSGLGLGTGMAEGRKGCVCVPQTSWSTGGARRTDIYLMYK